MYIWIGCRLPQSFETALRQFCRQANADLQLSEAAFQLPQHISLKISFDAGDHWQAVIERLKSWCNAQRPCTVSLQSPQQVPGVLWLPVAENDTLRKLHRDLDALLETEFHIPQHPFDKDFRFHSTLFQDADEKLAQIYPRLTDLHFPEPLGINTFLLGIAQENAPGAYRVTEQITV